MWTRRSPQPSTKLWRRLVSPLRPHVVWTPPSLIELNSSIQSLPRYQTLTRFTNSLDGQKCCFASKELMLNTPKGNEQAISCVTFQDLSTYFFDNAVAGKGADKWFKQGYSQVPNFLATGLDIRFCTLSFVEYSVEILEPCPVQRAPWSFHCDVKTSEDFCIWLFILFFTVDECKKCRSNAFFCANLIQKELFCYFPPFYWLGPLTILNVFWSGCKKWLLQSTTLGQSCKQVSQVRALHRVSKSMMNEPLGEVFESDFVVITVPLGVLKTGSISFSPPLPASISGAISRLAMGLLVGRSSDS